MQNQGTATADPPTVEFDTTRVYTRCPSGQEVELTQLGPVLAAEPAGGLPADDLPADLLDRYQVHGFVFVDPATRRVRLTSRGHMLAGSLPR